MSVNIIMYHATTLLTISLRPLYIYILIIQFLHYTSINVRFSYHFSASLLWMLSSLFFLATIFIRSDIKSSLVGSRYYSFDIVFKQNLGIKYNISALRSRLILVRLRPKIKKKNSTYFFFTRLFLTFDCFKSSIFDKIGLDKTELPNHNLLKISLFF